MNAWTRLGLKRTDDVTEIRRAYARKLKATDVDADPAAFIALREALERALSDAHVMRHRQAVAAGGGEVPPDAETSLPAAWPPVADIVPTAHSEPEPAPAPAAPAGEDPNARFIALEQLLFPGEGAPPPDPDALEAAVRAILDHPDMDQVDRGANVEIWLAEALFDAIPRSDPVIPMVIAHFHWDRKAGHWDQPWMFEELIKRRDAFVLLDGLRDPRHRYHKAWRDLTSDKAGLGLGSVGRREDVAHLLNVIREKGPAAEAHLNPHRVALWDARLNRTVVGRLKWAMLGFWALFILLKIFGAVGGSSTTTSSLPPVLISSYASAAGDLDPYLDRETNGALDLAALETRNPALRDLLVARWNEARDGAQPRQQFDRDVRVLIEGKVGEGLRGGSYELQSTYWRLRAEEYRHLQTTDVDACATGVTTNRANAAPLDPRMAQLNASALSAPPRHPPPALMPGAVNRFTIPGEIVARALRRSGLDDAVLTAAFLGRGTSAQRCAGRIALIEAALEVPEREGARLLRDMSRAL